MDIHKPKPWHGWREFLKEYGIIVLGVLTALAFEQIAEALHHRSEAEETRAALQAEIADGLERAVYDVQEVRCYQKVLDVYDAWAMGGPRPEVPTLDLAHPLYTVWQTARSVGVLQMPLRERLDLADFYGRVENLYQIDTQQRAVGQVVRGYLGLGTLTPAEGRDLRRATSGYRVLLSARLANEQNVLAEGAKLGVRAPTVQQFRAKFPQAWAQLEKICGAAGAKLEMAP